VNVSIPNGLIILTNTRNLMGGNFLTYWAQDKNCQSLILAMLQSINMSTPQNALFTKQSTQELFTPQLRKITNTITDIAGKVDKWTTGCYISGCVLSMGNAIKHWRSTCIVALWIDSVA
jgi:hypothetical protein